MTGTYLCNVSTIQFTLTNSIIPKHHFIKILIGDVWASEASWAMPMGILSQLMEGPNFAY